MTVRDRQVQTIAGIACIAAMLVFLVLAITTFRGTPTFLLVVAALIFLGLALFFLSGPGSAGVAGQAQQQSVVLADGRVIEQRQDPGGSTVLRVCSGCGARVQENFAHCPHCGAAQG